MNILYLIIGITVLVSMMVMERNDLKNRWAFSPYAVQHHGESSRLLGHIFVHVDWAHLIFNMLSLYFLGQVLLFEFSMYYGFWNAQVYFIGLYLLGAIGATIIPFVRNRDNPSYLAMGASGAVSAVVFAAIIWRPDMRLSLLFIPIALPAYWFGLLYFLYEFWADRRGNTGIAHDAHIGGALSGILFIFVLNYQKIVSFWNFILP